MAEKPSIHPLPPHTILERRREGTNVVTTVILDGEILEFEINESTRRAAELLTMKPEAQDE